MPRFVARRSLLLLALFSGLPLAAHAGWKLDQDASDFHFVSIKPVVINAEDFGMVNGINKLTELAGLPVISTAVPVTFNLVYHQD